jgi:hypothetical protein
MAHSIITEAEYGGAGQNYLVHEIEHVGDKEKRHNYAVNLLDNLLRHGCTRIIPCRPSGCLR